jgi:hypothetical protein
MSHHLDSPIARQDVRLDISDFYLFRGERGTVFVMNIGHSFAGQQTRGFHPEAKYEFKIDLDGDAVEELTYRLTFGERAGGTQELRLVLVSGPQAAEPDAPGTELATGATGTTIELADGLRLWTGRAGDPFWLEPDVLHAVGAAFTHGTTVDLAGWDPARATNLFSGHTVHSIVLELPDAAVVPLAGSDRRIGAWALSSLATDAGGWRPINRAGLPMIHPLFTQLNEDLGDRLNTGRPADDRQMYGKTLADMVAGVVGAHRTASDPHAYGQRVAEALLPNLLPYTLGTPAALGFAGWNGRSLTDNAPDVMFSFASNTPLAIGIGRDSVAVPPSGTFPYVPAEG